MAEYEDDFDDDYYYEDDYLYVEDAFALADELAENQLPPAPLLDGIDEYDDDYDLYDFWMDIEYGTDEYYDVPMSWSGDKATKSASRKRKAQPVIGEEVALKRRKVSGNGAQLSSVNREAIWQGPNVVWLANVEMYRPIPFAESKGPEGGYSLLPAWKDLLRDVGEQVSNVETTALAAQPSSRSRKKKTIPRQHAAASAQGLPSPEQPNIQPVLDMLKARLEGSGMDKATIQGFERMLLQSLDRGNGLEDALEELTGSLLESVGDEGVESGLGRWLTSQGVDLDGQEEVVDRDGGSSDPDDGTDLVEDKDKDNGDEDQPAMDVDQTSHSTVNGTGQTLNGSRSASKRQDSKDVDEAVAAKDDSEARRGGGGPKAKGKKRKAAEQVDEDMLAPPAKAGRKQEQPVRKSTRSTRSQR